MNVYSFCPVAGGEADVAVEQATTGGDAGNAERDASEGGEAFPWFYRGFCSDGGERVVERC